jgi:hypothetical protein
MKFVPDQTPRRGSDPSPNAWVWRLAIVAAIAGAVIGYVVGNWLAAAPVAPAP